MPIYEYLCSKCGVFEAMQRITEKQLTQCPTCHRKVTKLISRGAFQLKGSGWYLTDYARKPDGEGKGEKNDKDKGTEAKDAGAEAPAASPGGPAEKKGKKAGGEKVAAA
jgi:putative FmdB family regulatory protein